MSTAAAVVGRSTAVMSVSPAALCGRPWKVFRPSHAVIRGSLPARAFNVMPAQKLKSHIGEGMAPELRGSHLLHTRGLINGEWKESSTSATYEVINPATGDVIANVARMGWEDAWEAVDAAEAAFPSWAATSAQARADILRKWHDLIVANADELARIVTLEAGKPLKEAQGETALGAKNVRWASEEGVRAYGDVIPPPGSDRRLVAIRQPIGVVGAITPWNFPLAMITRKVAPALAVGCTVVLKPAEETPLTAHALVELAREAGVPDGCLNVVSGDKEGIGSALLHSDAVRKIAFTGSTAVGKMLMAESADSVKKVSLELGGNAPFIVFNDADVGAAAAAAAGSAFRNSGQTCICTGRILVQEGVHDEFAEALAKEVRKLEVGNGMDPATTQGPLISEAAVERVDRHVTDAVDKGAVVLAGGRRHEEGSHFYDPTVLVGATREMAVFQEETFGPVAPIFSFKDEKEAIAMANDTEYGLACYFFTNDLARTWRVAEALEYGMVGVNEVNITGEQIPFGGWKQSGLGREGGKHAVDEFLETKYICMGIGGGR